MLGQHSCDTLASEGSAEKQGRAGVDAPHGRSRNADYSLVVHGSKSAGTAVCAKSLHAASIVARIHNSALVYVCLLLEYDAL